MKGGHNGSRSSVQKQMAEQERLVIMMMVLMMMLILMIVMMRTESLSNMQKLGLCSTFFCCLHFRT